MQACTRSGAPAGCTGCGTLSEWVHSRYVRRLADAALGGRPVRIDLSVRRLYCENSACPKVTFAEQVPGLTVRAYADSEVARGVPYGGHRSAGAALYGCSPSWRMPARQKQRAPVRVPQLAMSALMRLPVAGRV
ncbi:transposase family protein [Streptomyces europaeiscabiei]|uniref:transposase family protein n=1 Tax=Streptomyces europaeiscabiei TaxID=146819 RepID=UPI0029AEC31C|nr:transposase family protein [Streptomyces europaeiscabiei]MDX2758411.1 transposase family protein [Streptomyces europaeiscabiei]MDX2770308.1 transposase family protein [Streptomyces europaeiscabiei]